MRPLLALVLVAGCAGSAKRGPKTLPPRPPVVYKNAGCLEVPPPGAPGGRELPTPPDNSIFEGGDFDCPDRMGVCMDMEATVAVSIALEELMDYAMLAWARCGPNPQPERPLGGMK